MTVTQASDSHLVARLRAGDEQAFAALVDQYHRSLVRLARTYVGSRAAAEDVAQETWLGVLRGIDRFEGRAALKTWIYRILVNRAKTRAQRDGRQIPFSALMEAEQAGAEPSVDPHRFRPPDAPQYPGGWADPPRPWAASPEDRLLSRETLKIVEEAVARLPHHQQVVISLRDIEGWSADEVCDLLKITGNHQRVLLHRARSKVRTALEPHLAVSPEPAA